MGSIVILSDFKSKKEIGVIPVQKEDVMADQINAFNEYTIESEIWSNNRYWESLYEGYPYEPPCAPTLEDMEWYVGNENFGVWILNKSKKEIKATPDIYGWNPFVRYSTAPLYQPLNVSSAGKRKLICWIVDEDGYGQYGMVNVDGYVWIPHIRPGNFVVEKI